MAFSSSKIEAQEKQNARISVQYNKIGNQNLLKISAKYKEDKKFVPASDLNLKVYKTVSDDSTTLLGTLKLAKDGNGIFDVSNEITKGLDTISFSVVHEASDKFEEASNEVGIKLANLSAVLNLDDETTPTIMATLTDVNNVPLEGVELKVKLQRSFAPLAIGEDSYFTDESGTINVPITVKMPGLDGKLIYEVIIDENETYGSIKTIIESNLGTKIKDLSTFDQRTMWGPPRKAPLVALIVPNLLIFGIWLTLFFLIFNLYRISKQKKS
ncbi:MAG: hypothetical protein COX71_05450 [Flavobacteriales bacterium CG_4_10_14_0_2_um_filter_35_18]|nr:MAG: hypothetical protein COX71_05450 [Flavobacteriales bacterium CG_4_10_14_0_2_um_filter_35_18]